MTVTTRGVRLFTSRVGIKFLKDIHVSPSEDTMQVLLDFSKIWPEIRT